MTQNGKVATACGALVFVVALIAFLSINQPLAKPVGSRLMGKVVSKKDITRANQKTLLHLLSVYKEMEKRLESISPESDQAVSVYAELEDLHMQMQAVMMQIPTAIPKEVLAFEEVRVLATPQKNGP